MYSAIEKYDVRDYKKEVAGNGSSYMGEKNAAKCFSNLKYNQKLVDRYSCTGQAACGVISDVTGFGLPLIFRKKVWENQLETGAKEGFGDNLQNGMKQAVKLFNEEYPELDYELEYNRIDDIRGDEMLDVLELSSILTGYKGKLYGDAQDNGVIDNADNPDGGGHAIRFVKGWKVAGEGKTAKYCDNYEGVNPFNIVEVPNIEDNKDFFRGGYWVEKVKK